MSLSCGLGDSKLAAEGRECTVKAGDGGLLMVGKSLSAPLSETPETELFMIVCMFSGEV